MSARIFSTPRGLRCVPGRGGWRADPQLRPGSHAGSAGNGQAGIPGSFGRPSTEAANGRSYRLAGTPEDRLAALDLPPKFSQVLAQGSAQFGLRRTSLVVPLLTISGSALGAHAIVETELFPGPVNPSLICVLCGGDAARAMGLVQAAVQVLRDEQDSRLQRAGELHGKGLEREIRRIEKERDRFFACDVVRDTAAVATFTERIENLRRLGQPLLVTESPPPGGLYQASAANGGGGLFAFYDERAVAKQLESRKRLEMDFALLASAGAGRTPEQSFRLQGKSPAVVRPVIGCVMICSSAILAQLLCSENSAARQLAEHILVSIPAASGSGSRFNGPGLAQLAAWVDTISQFLTLCDAGQAPRLGLSRAAFLLLSSYAGELERPQSGPGRLAGEAPRLALKLAAILHFWTGDWTRAIPAWLMRTAIALTKMILSETAEASNQCVSQREEAAREHAADLMWDKLRGKEPSSERRLFRRFDDSRNSVQGPVLAYLIDRGRVRRRKDGFLETLPRPEGPES